MKQITGPNLIFLKSIGIWVLFLLASIKTLELFVGNYYLLMCLFPGLFIFGFFIYYSLKTANFLKFWKYLLAVVSLTFFFILSYLIIFTYIRQNYYSNIIEIVLAIAAASILIPVCLYWLTRLFKWIIWR